MHANIQSFLGRLNFKEFLQFLFPITIWLPQYDLSKLKGDIIAGLTVGIMIMPQSIAFASLSGLPPEYGLYAGLTPGIVYAFFGTSKDISVGPTVTMALFTSRYNPSFVPTGASILAFMVGLVLILMGVFKLGIVANFMPSHVLNGFISAAALTIISTQLRGLFGHKKPPRNFFEKIYHFFANIHRPNPWDLVLSIFCIIYLAFFMWLSKRNISKPAGDNVPLRKQILSKVLWFLCVARSALVCIFGTIVAYIFIAYGYDDGFTLAGKLPKGLPQPEFPLQSFETGVNKTVTVNEALKGFGASLIILPTIQFIQSISIAKAFGKMYDYNVNSMQELFGIGMANLVGSFFGGWPVCGSFSRSAVNAMSGTRTPLSGAFSCLVIMFAVSVLTPVFQYIPKSALSSMIVMAVITMIDYKTPWNIWKVRHVDIVPYLLSFFGTFYQLEAGVLAGAIVALLIMIYREVTPKVEISYLDQTAFVSFQKTPFYPCVEELKDKLQEFAGKEIKIIKVDMSSVYETDYTTITTFKAIYNDLKKSGKSLVFVDFINPDVEMSFKKACVCECENNGEENDLKKIENDDCEDVPLKMLADDEDVELQHSNGNCHPSA